jgi:hypothetical protein
MILSVVVVVAKGKVTHVVSTPSSRPSRAKMITKNNTIN